jgi:hypothetical protein
MDCFLILLTMKNGGIAEQRKHTRLMELYQTDQLASYVALQISRNNSAYHQLTPVAHIYHLTKTKSPTIVDVTPESQFKPMPPLVLHANAF